MQSHTVTTTNTRGSTLGGKSSGVGAYLGNLSLRMCCPHCDTRRSGPCGHHTTKTKIIPR